MKHHDERGIEAAEIAGDLFEEISREEHYLDWCERNGVTPSLVNIGTDTDAEGEEVSVWTFA